MKIAATLIHAPVLFAVFSGVFALRLAGDPAMKLLIAAGLLISAPSVLLSMTGIRHRYGVILKILSAILLAVFALIALPPCLVFRSEAERFLRRHIVSRRGKLILHAASLTAIPLSAATWRDALSLPRPEFG